MNNSVTIQTDKGPITVSWSRFDKLLQVLSRQKPSVLNHDLSKFYTLYWQNMEGLRMFDLPSNSKILDIGAGNSVVDLFLYQYANAPTIYLLDMPGDLTTDIGTFFSETEEYKFYHTWSVVEDAITTSNYDADKFKFITPSDDWPEDLDLITSYASWCWHYPLSAYWDRVKQSLKTGGVLSIDISNNAVEHTPDLISTISEEFKSKPIIMYSRKVETVNSCSFNYSNYYYGGKYVWTRK